MLPSVYVTLTRNVYCVEAVRPLSVQPGTASAPLIVLQHAGSLVFRRSTRYLLAPGIAFHATGIEVGPVGVSVTPVGAGPGVVETIGSSIGVLIWSVAPIGVAISRPMI